MANPSAASLDIATSTEPDLICDTTFVSASALTPTPVTTATAYYEDGRVMGTRDANGKWTMHDYDEAGQVWRTRQFVNADGTDIAGVTITTLFNYDKNGNQTGILDPNQFEAIGGWPAANASTWRTRAFTDNPTRCTITTFDQLNRPTRVDLPCAVTSAAFTQSKFDWAGRKWLEIDADNKATAYVYDALGRLNWVITDLNPATTALPNPLPADFYTHVWAARQADSTVTRYGYDEVGNLIAQTDGNGRKTEFGYDGIGRRTARKLPGNVRKNGVDVPAIEYWQPDYNSPASGPKLNQIRHLDLNGRYVLNRYDSMGREIERRPDGLLSWAAPLPTGGDAPVTFTYAATGQRASMTDASGTTRYAYDERNLLRIK